jgi:hypothetical protein
MKKIIYALLFLAACQSAPKTTVYQTVPTLVDYQMGFGFSTYDSAFASTLTPVKVQAVNLYIGTTVLIDNVSFYGNYKYYKISNQVVQINNNGVIINTK